MIRIDSLPRHLCTYQQSKFDILYRHKPEEISRVLVYDKNTDTHIEKQIFRSYHCFGVNFEFEPNNKKSYMFMNQEDRVPKDFIPYMEYAKQIDPRDNQMVINYYEPSSYIEMHRDCRLNYLSRNSPILCHSLSEGRDERLLSVQHIHNESSFKFVGPQFYSYILNDNENFRHGVGTGKCRRISITFRMMKEPNDE